MIKRILLISGLAIFQPLFSQEQPHGCASAEMFQQMLKTDPVFAKNQALLEKETQEFAAKKIRGKASAANMIIPIVFHIIHTGGADNISDAQIQDQVATLNTDFQRMMADTTLTPAAFKPYAGALNVEFRLATIDPNGNCTQGITRTYSTLANCAYDPQTVKSLVYWPSNKYFNVWVVSVLRYSTGGSCSGGGYAQFPGGGSTFTDGVIIRGDLIGSIGTSATNGGWGNFRGRYLIHEAGHWLNLRHIWGDAVCGNDLVSDTPPAPASNSGCPLFPHNANNSCGAGADGEMYDDYMDYSQGACLNLFTQGQVTRMDAALNSTAGGRLNLWSAGNLAATGTQTGIIPDCPPVPDMMPYLPITVCEGSTVKFTDVSYGGSISSRSWTFTGGTTSDLISDSIINVTYASPGIYDVGLSVGNINGTNANTFYQRVVVYANTANVNYLIPYSEGFEFTNNFTNDWSVINYDNDSTWHLTNTTSYSGVNSLMLGNYEGPGPRKDDAVSPAFDMTAFSSVKVNFRLHFTSLDAANNDQLLICASKDCGVNWNVRYNRIANTGLRTTTVQYPYDYFPSVGSSEWRRDSFTVTSAYISAATRLLFRFTSGGGNNIFIDDINMNGTPLVGIENILQADELVKLYPNPAGDKVQVSFTLNKTVPVTFVIRDVCGKEIKSMHLNFLQPGNHDIPLDIGALSQGAYFLQVRSGDLILSTNKLMIQR